MILTSGHTEFLLLTILASVNVMFFFLLFIPARVKRENILDLSTIPVCCIGIDGLEAVHLDPLVYHHHRDHIIHIEIAFVDNLNTLG